MIALWILLVCQVGGLASFTPTEWRDKIIHRYYDWTKAFDEQDIDALMDIYSVDCIEMQPGRHVFNKQELKEIMRENVKQFRFMYAGFVKIIHSTEEVALARHVAFAVSNDGKEVPFHGVRMFVKRGEEIMVKVSIFN